jgi:LDH2 family malate/lactate/ureidoglycolate dehydrogenase
VADGEIDRSCTPPARFPATEAALRLQIGAIFEAWGANSQSTASAVDALVWADMRGIASHGIAMLPIYERWLAAGRFDPGAMPQTIIEREAFALVDGGSGFGFETARYGMSIATAKARSAGVAVVSVRRSNHFGAAGHWANMASDAGMIGMAMTSTVSPAIVPTGGKRARLGTNPIALAAPASSGPPFLLDMATSTVALGKLMVAALRGHSIPVGWALDPDGHPTTDPVRGYASRLATPLGSLPELGSHKGYGLAAMVEILSAVLAGATLSMDDGAGVAAGDVGHFFLVIDPGAFRPDGGFETDLLRMMAELRATPALNPGEPVQVAGDPERAILDQTLADGVHLPEALVSNLRALCLRAGCRFTLDG